MQANQSVDPVLVSATLSVRVVVSEVVAHDVFLVMDDDPGAPDVHGDELAVGVRELRRRDEIGQRTRVRVGEGLDDELVEVLLDLIARLRGEREDEVGEQVVLGRARRRCGAVSMRGATRRAEGPRTAPG